MLLTKSIVVSSYLYPFRFKVRVSGVRYLPQILGIFKIGGVRYLLQKIWVGYVIYMRSKSIIFFSACGGSPLQNRYCEVQNHEKLALGSILGANGVPKQVYAMIGI